MTDDSAYIPSGDIPLDPPRSSAYMAIAASHAVVDSVAAELADALRSLIGDPIPDGVAGIHYRQYGALQRFDNLNNNKEQ